MQAFDGPDYGEIRAAVAKLCAGFPGPDRRALDREGRYPAEFVEVPNAGSGDPQ